MSILPVPRAGGLPGAG